jgi:hypothetical protein
MNFARSALAVALATAASSAAALPLNTSFNVVLNVSGATAQENMLVLAAVDLCNPADLDVWSHGNFRAVTCTMNSGPLAGQTLRVNKSGVGGSGNGVGPVFAQTPVAFFSDAAWGSCTTTTTVTSTVSTGVKSYRQFTGCTAGTVNLVPHAGLSDVEPALFGQSPGPGDVAVGTSALSFGITASTTLRNAMQAAQNLTVGSDDVAQMPSISSAELASVLTGNLGTADLLSGGPVVTANGGAIDIARRVDTSGTQKISEVALLNQGCSAGVSVMLSAGTTLAGATVIEGSGSSDVRNALVAANQANRAAIGLLSTETAPTAHIKYLKIDGFSPSIENIINGSYRYVSFNNFNYDASIVGTPRAQIAQALIQRLSLAPIIGAANTAWNYGTWQGGFVGGFDAVLAGAVPDARPVSLVQARANPVFGASKDGFGGLSLNNCGSVQLSQ